MQVWVATESGNLEVTYTHNEEHVCVISRAQFLYIHKHIILLQFHYAVQYFVIVIEIRSFLG